MTEPGRLPPGLSLGQGFPQGMVDTVDQKVLDGACPVSGLYCLDAGNGTSVMRAEGASTLSNSLESHSHPHLRTADLCSSLCIGQHPILLPLHLPSFSLL